MAATGSKDAKGAFDAGKYVRYTSEQVDALERLYNECPKPSSLRRQQLIRECPILQNIEPRQIKVWFQNRRCREKQRKESARLQTVNGKLTAMNKLLMEENDRLQKQVAQLLYENSYLRQQLQHGGITTTDTSCDSVVTSGLQRLATPQHPPHDATHSSIISLAEETLTEFLAKATGTAVDWIPLCGMKPGSESTGMVNISRACTGVAARACGLVGLEPARVVGILKDRPSWQRDCRRLSTLCATSTGNGGTIEVLYMQMYAPTTLAPARDFCTLRYTTPLEDGSYVMCERSLNGMHGVPTTPPMASFVRADMLSSGCLIRPCEGSASIVILVDHMDMEPWTVPEVLRPLYESSAVLAHRMSEAALRHLRVVAQESGAIEAARSGATPQPAHVRSLSQRLCRGFNDAVNGFADDGWTTIGNDAVDDITIVMKPNFKELGHLQSGGVVCAKGSMLLQNVPPALIVRFLREHRAEWADYKAVALRIDGSCIPHTESSCSQIFYCQTQNIEQDEFLELIKLEDNGLQRDDALSSTDTLLLQHCSGLEENAAGACSQMVFAPIDANISDDVPLLPSGFRVIRLDRGVQDGDAPSRTLDLASTLEVGPGQTRLSDHTTVQVRSVLTIAFQFPYESHLQEGVSSVARQFVRKVVSTIQRVAMVLAPARIHSLPAPATHLQGSPEDLTLARLVCRSYNRHVGIELVHIEGDETNAYLQRLWQHSDAIVCCSCKNLPMFTFANQAGLDMLETTSAALHELSLDKTVDEEGKKDLCSILHQVLQQGYAYFPAGVRLSSKGRPASYDRAVVWKVLDDEDSVHGVAFAYTNWSLI